MPKVTLHPDKQELKDIDRALSKLKKMVEKGGILKTLLEKQQYERPGIKRNRKKAAAIMRWKRKLSKQELPKKYY